MNGPEQHSTGDLAQNAEYYLRVLHELIDMGTDLARQVHQQAQSPAQSPAPTPGPVRPDSNAGTQAAIPDPTIAFERIARCIRRTICLARKLSEPLPAPMIPDAQRRTAARKRIIRAIEDDIHSKARPEDFERLHADFRERLDDPDLDDDIASRPIEDIIREICRDLGLAHLAMTRPFKRRSATEVANLAARAAMKPRADVPASNASGVVVEMRQAQPNVSAKTTGPPH